MKHGSAFIYFNLAYVIGLICFLILFYFNIRIILLTIFIIITSIVLLIVNLAYWYSIRKTVNNKNGKYKKENKHNHNYLIALIKKKHKNRLHNFKISKL